METFGFSPESNQALSHLVTGQLRKMGYVAPARETSILVAALYGTHFLKEVDVARRLVAAFMMVLGLAGIALA